MRTLIVILTSILLIQGVRAQDTYYWYNRHKKNLVLSITENLYWLIMQQIQYLQKIIQRKNINI